MEHETFNLNELAKQQEEALFTQRRSDAAENARLLDTFDESDEDVQEPLSKKKGKEKEGRSNDTDMETNDDVKVMQDAHHEFKADNYFSSGNVTALVELDEFEREDDAIVMSMKNIHKTYLLGIEGVPALRGVSLSVRRGEFLVIFGTSGGGKTSLLNIMGTIDKPTKGHIKISGTRISRSTTDAELSEIRRAKLGFVFQTFNLLSSLTALENVMLPMILAGKTTRSQRVRRAKRLLTRVGMGKRFDHLPSQLSGGEQQRVTIARSIANKPDILLLDEPTGDLDHENTVIVMKLLSDLHRKKKLTLIMVTHELGLKSFADRVVWMRDGRIQTVERISPRKREDAYIKLEEEFQNLDEEKRKFVRVTSDSEEDEEDEDALEMEPTGDLELGNRKERISHITRGRGGGGEEEEQSLLQEDENNEISMPPETLVRTEIRRPTDYTTHPERVKDLLKRNAQKKNLRRKEK